MTVQTRAAEFMAAFLVKAGDDIAAALGGLYTALIIAAEDPELATEIRHLVERAKARSQGITPEQVEQRLRDAFHMANDQ